jgi:NTE family protein
VEIDTNSLRKLPLFAALSEEGLRTVSERLQPRYYAEGEVILRAGEPASELHIVIEGAAQVELGADAGRARRAFLGAGQTIGEMSLLTDAAVSATVIAQRNTTTLALGADALSALLEREPGLYRVFLAQLADRLRHRTHAAKLRPAVAVLARQGNAAEIGEVVASLARGVQHYAPGSICPPGQATPEEVTRSMSEWRQKGAGGQYLVLTLPAGALAAIRDLLEAGDVALTIATDQSRAIDDSRQAGVADSQVVMVGNRSRNRDPWVHCVTVEEARAASAGVWDRRRYPEIDRVARYVTSREIGVALSVGAAAGLAHAGFLEVLERADIPIDYLCGSSMGGAVALAYGAFGSAERACDAICRVGVEFARTKGIQLLPRAALVAQRRMQRMAHELFGERMFSELSRPIAVVAADIVAGERVVLDRGSVGEAAQATGAIPGLFPPVMSDNRVLVDGGLVTRIPLDLLSRRRCGLTLAAIARSHVPMTSDARSAEFDRLHRRLAQPLGFRAALGASWKLLGWWDSAAQAQKADVVVNIDTPARDGFNFAAGTRMAECGRRATEERLTEIHAAVQRMLMPGMP